MFLAGTQVGFSSIAYASSNYYVSAIRVATDKATYVCGDVVQASTVLYSGNLTAKNFPVSLEVTSPSGNVRGFGSTYSDGFGIARFLLSLPADCEMGVYTVLATTQDSYGFMNAADKFTVNPPNEYVALNFNRIWYGLGDSVGLTGELVTGCNLTYVTGQTVRLNLIGPHNDTLRLGTARVIGRSFTTSFDLPASAAAGLYKVEVMAFDPCQNTTVSGNAFFPVIQNIPAEPWSIDVGSNQLVYETGNPIELFGVVRGGPYFSCRAEISCAGNGTFPPIDVSLQVVNANGVQVYAKTMNIGLPYYQPSYGFQDLVSGNVNDTYLPPGQYVATAEVSTAGFPTVQTATSFTVVRSFSEFTLSTTPSTVAMIAPSSDSVALIIDPANMSNSQVNLSASWSGNAPANVTVQLSPITSITDTSWVTDLTISAGSSTPQGVYNLTVTGNELSQPNLSRTVQIQVTFVDLFSQPSAPTADR
jgi:hypothetical protein